MRVGRLQVSLGVLFVGFILLLFICLLIIFTYLFFAYRKIRKVLTGVLARVQALSPGSNPGFDVNLSIRRFWGKGERWKRKKE